MTSANDYEQPISVDQHVPPSSGRLMQLHNELDLMQKHETLLAAMELKAVHLGSQP